MTLPDPLRILLAEAADESRSAKHYLAGAHRACDPAETFRRVEPRLAEFGITRVADVTGLDNVGIPVVMVHRPNSRSLAVSQGKGATLDAARASGVMEGIELHHAEHIDLPLRYGSRRDIARVLATVEPHDLPLMAGTAFDDDRPLLWVDAVDLASGEAVAVPYDVVHTNYAQPMPPDAGCFDASTNGLASGNTLAEAVCHGLCEVIERDAVSLWNLSPPDLRAAARIDPATIDSGLAADLLQRFEAAGIAAALWDVTGDVGVASFACGTWEHDAVEANPTLGTGTHPCRAVAAVRAITEAAQIRLTYISGARDDLSDAAYADSGRRARMRYLRALLGDADTPLADFRDVPDYRSDSAAADLRWVRGRLAAVGLDRVLAVNLSKPAHGIAIARVVVPGLEGIDSHAEYVPGRRARALLGDDG
ncbi:MAG: YcaO-like family protein [Alphaproteobacteria bacterium]